MFFVLWFAFSNIIHDIVDYTECKPKNKSREAWEQARLMNLYLITENTTVYKKREMPTRSVIDFIPRSMQTDFIGASV